MKWSERGARAARRLLAEHPDLERAPVDVEALAGRLGIRLREVEMDDETSGMLIVKSNGASAIAVNQEHHPHRKRFTVAHELGHWAMHISAGTERHFVDHLVVKRRDRRASQGTEREEVEANAFAAELLMPTRLVRKAFPGSTAVNAWDLHEGRLRRLARRFRVSDQAMSIRLVALGLVAAEF